MSAIGRCGAGRNPPELISALVSPMSRRTARASAMGLSWSTAVYYLASALIATATPVLSSRYGMRPDGVLAFWIAYVLTRPLGASLADLVSLNVSCGGLELGDGDVGDLRRGHRGASGVSCN